MYAAGIPRESPGQLAAPVAMLGASGIVALLGAMALHTALVLYHIDTFPPKNYDEDAYTRAAQMQRGRVDPETVVAQTRFYTLTYAQYRAQRVPLLLQSAGLALFDRSGNAAGPSARLAVRLVSVVAMAAALLAAALALRRTLGSAAVAAMLFLCASAPLCLAFARAGFYVAISVLHGALAFAALLALLARRTYRTAAILGALCGASLYFYQLSWFVPLLAVAAICASPGWWQRPGTLRLGAVAAAAADMVLAPGLIGMQDGLRKVLSQTFDERAADPTTTDTAALVFAVAGAPPGVTSTAAKTLALELRALPRLHAAPTSIRSRPVIALRGDATAVADALNRIQREGWQVLVREERVRSPIVRAGRTLAQLFRGPVQAGAVQWTEVPLLRPIIAPLVVLGLVAGWARMREPAVRALLVWVVGSAMLPAMAGGVVPRRMVLMLPFVWGLAALPLLEVFGLAVRRGAAARCAVVIAFALLYLAALSLDAHDYFERWVPVGRIAAR